MNVQPRDRWSKHFDFIILDAAAIIFSYLLSISVYFRDFNYLQAIYRAMIPVILLLSVLLEVLFAFHKSILKRGPFAELLQTIKFVVTLAILFTLYQYFVQVGALFSRGLYILFWVTSVLWVYLTRMWRKKVVNHRLAKADNRSRLMIVCDASLLQENIDYFSAHGKQRYVIDVIAAMNPIRGDTPNTINDIRILYGTQEMYDYLLKNVVDEVFLNLSNTDQEAAISRELVIMGKTIHINLNRVFNAIPNRFVEC